MPATSSRAEAQERAAAMRAEQQRKEKQRKQIIFAATAFIVAVLGVVVALTIAGRKDPSPTKADSTDFVATATKVPTETFDQAGAGRPLEPVAGGTPLKDGKKARVVYVGAGFCSACASERWALLAALSRFGTFSGVTASSSDEQHGNLPTVSFEQVKFTSDYVTFDATEMTDREGKPLKEPSPDVKKIRDTHNPKGSFPFTYFGTHKSIGTGVDPGLLVELADQPDAWDSIAKQMAKGDTELGKAIDAHANTISAIICQGTGQQPAAVCSSKGVTEAAKQLQ